jgi:hypothetical protein
MTTDQRIRPDVRSARADARRDVLILAPGLLPFGIALGIVIGSSAMGDGAGVLGAPLVYGGSAQLTATTLFQQGAGLLAVVGSALTVNARLLFYSAALAPRFNAHPAWFGRHRRRRVPASQPHRQRGFGHRRSGADRPGPRVTDRLPAAGLSITRSPAQGGPKFGRLMALPANAATGMHIALTPTTPVPLATTPTHA